MPCLSSFFELEIDSKARPGHRHAEGPVGAEEFLAGFGRMLAHPDYHPGMRILVDMLAHVHQVDARTSTDRPGLRTNGEALRGSEVAVVVAEPSTTG